MQNLGRLAQEATQPVRFKVGDKSIDPRPRGTYSHTDKCCPFDCWRAETCPDEFSQPRTRPTRWRLVS